MLGLPFPLVVAFVVSARSRIGSRAIDPCGEDAQALLSPRRSDRGDMGVKKEVINPPPFGTLTIPPPQAILAHLGTPISLEHLPAGDEVAVTREARAKHRPHERLALCLKPRTSSAVRQTGRYWKKRVRRSSAR